MASNVGRGAAPRRFSLRPVLLPSGQFPGSGTASSGKEEASYSSDARQDVARSHANTFVVESPKRSLIETEGGPGVSSPMTQQPAAMARRRFSLRPPQPGGLQPEGSGAAVSSKGIMPRWKAGMLQRQIGQSNLRRRARAFSLSDVYTDYLESGGGPKDSTRIAPSGGDVALQHGAGGATRGESKALGDDPSVVSPREPWRNIAARPEESARIAMPAEEYPSVMPVIPSEASRGAPLEWVDVFSVPIVEAEGPRLREMRIEERKSSVPSTTFV